jgi:hypothetical protein
MQLACQCNSLNRRSFTEAGIAELSEILTVQKNERTVVGSSAEVTQERERKVLLNGGADTEC